MDIKDYKNFDYLTLLTKKDKLDSVLKVYKSFGWEDVEQKEDKIYDDTLVLTLRRKHKIKNKDKLQLLQVNMETELDRLEKVEKNKRSKSTTFGLTCGLGLIVLLIVGIYLVATSASVFARFGGIILTVISAILLILTMIKINSLVKEDDKVFLKISKKIQKQIEVICENAKKLNEVQSSGD